jgi:hypothetical protein
MAIYRGAKNTKRLPLGTTLRNVAATCWPNPETCADVAEGVWQHYANDPRIERMCWFPARWDPAWTDPGGVGWTAQRLIDDDGMLTSVGVVYQGLGGNDAN